MKTIFILIAVFVTGLGLWFVLLPASVSEPVEEPSEMEEDTASLDPVISAHIESKSDLIIVDSPRPNDMVANPLTITGQARGYWFFEASFPVILTDWDGKIITEHYATAEGEWMTEEFVPFTTILEFESPYKESDPDFMQRGTLILKKQNASGLPENDDALEFPVLFKAE